MGTAAASVRTPGQRNSGLLSALYAHSIYIAMLIPLSLAAGYRWLGDGRDFITYYYYYNNIPSFFDLQNNRFEVGYQMAAYTFRLILDVDYEVFATVLAAVALGIKFFLFNKYLSRPFTATILYLGIFYPVHEYTQIRTAVAVSFAMLAIHLWMDKRRLWACVFFFAAFLFHYSIAALAAGFLISPLFKQPIRIAIAVFLLGAVMVLTDLVNIFASVAGALNPVVQDYAYGSDFYFEQNPLSVQNVAFAFVALYSMVFGIYKSSDYHARFTVLLLMGLAAIPIFFNAPVLAERLRDIMMVPAVFLVCRSPLTIREYPNLAVMLMLAAWQLWVALQNGLIVF